VAHPKFFSQGITAHRIANNCRGPEAGAARHEIAADRIAAGVGRCVQAVTPQEKAFTRARDTSAAEQRQMPWVAAGKAYMFGGPHGEASRPDLFEGRRQLIVCRAFFEPGVHGWPEHACIGVSWEPTSSPI
jgi:cytosine/adenosine deaminase-related metal-dependent hydrolase